jgi:hypothetical protein
MDHSGSGDGRIPLRSNDSDHVFRWRPDAPSTHGEYANWRAGVLRGKSTPNWEWITRSGHQKTTLHDLSALRDRQFRLQTQPYHRSLTAQPPNVVVEVYALARKQFVILDWRLDAPQDRRIDLGHPANHIAQSKRRCDRPYGIRYRLSRTSPSFGPRKKAAIGRTGCDYRVRLRSR